MLKSCGRDPCLNALTKKLQKLKDHIYEESIAFKITPAGIHQRSKAERAIQTFNNRFIADL